MGKLFHILVILVLLSGFKSALKAQSHPRLAPDSNPRFGRVSLSEGFIADPYQLRITSRGLINISFLDLCGGCTGFVPLAPDFVLHWSGETSDLRLFFEADKPKKDASILINTPSGIWVGNNNAFEDTNNPMLDLYAYGEGQYAIWIGSSKRRERIHGTLTITELDKQPANREGERIELDVPYVPTSQNVVNAMLDIANVGEGDYVIDLGSGDGRIVVSAALKGAAGHGIDINPVRVKEASLNAEMSGVADRVLFIEENLFETDFTNATVITMYLLNSVNLQLKPFLLERLKPGTRIVSHAFSMGRWMPDKHLIVEGRHVYFWMIPTNAGGLWQWQINDMDFSMAVSQDFQVIVLTLSINGRSMYIENAELKGERVSFTALDRENRESYVFSGMIENDTISGMIQIRKESERILKTWHAKRLNH